MADIKIIDQASLEAWLKIRPRRDAEIIAFRAAARVFPLWGRAMEEEWAAANPRQKRRELSALICIRYLFSSQSAPLDVSLSRRTARDNSYTRYPTSSTYALDAAQYVFTTCRATLPLAVAKIATNSVVMADNAARSYTSAKVRGTLLRDAKFDLITLESELGMVAGPLWPTQTPDWFTTSDRETRAIWRKDPTTWAFWERWWDGVISGDMPFAPELLRDVALIEDDIWQAGPKAVAQAIDKLIAARALAMTDNGESVDINPDTGKLRLVGADTLPPDIDRYARRKMAKALALFDGELSNQYRPLDAPLRIIHAALSDSENLPMELFDACASASRMTAVLVETQSIPAPTQDPLIGEFVIALRETAADILAGDTTTQERLTRRKAIEGDTFLHAPAMEINVVVSQIITVSEGALQRLVPQNAEAAVDPTIVQEDRRIGAFKFAGRILRIAGWTIAAPIGALGATGAAIEGYHAVVGVVGSQQFQVVLAWILKWLGLG